jgi:muconate cycloisomerase
MKITHIEPIPISVPIKPRLAIRSSLGYHDRSPYLLVKVHTDEGITGLGEVTCTPIWSGEDNVTAAHFIRAILEPALVGQDPQQIEALSRRMNIVLQRNEFTKAGIEMALWDIKGKALGVPVYQLLGGKVREFVPTKFSISGLEPEKAAALGAWAVEQGFRAMKVKVGLDPDQDVARVKAVRDAIGPDIRLGVDANGGWSVRTAIQTLRRLQECGLFFAEQPVSNADVTWLAEVRRQATLPIIADESAFSLQDAMAVVRAGAADTLSVYVGKGGGLGPARKMAAVAEAAGLTCTVGSNIELGIASAAMIHLAMATPGIGAEEFPADIIGPLYYEDDLLAEPLPLRPGEARPSEKPGLGVELDEEKVRHFAP